MKDKLLALFEQNRGVSLSGNELAKDLGVSRAAVNKAVSALREQGYEIHAKSRAGYVFSEKNEILSPAGILKYTGQKFLVTVLEKSPSTNTELKALAANGAPEGTVLVTEHQTKGRGRLGKQFFSPEGHGIYFSLLLKPSLSASDSVFITVAAAVAVRRAIKNLLGITTEIKWVNDLYYGGKKFCGILTEAAFELESGGLSYAVLGIGLNLTAPEGGYPEEFAFKTTNISEFAGNFPDDFKNRLVAELLTEFDTLYQSLDKKAYLAEYKAASCVVGKEIRILTGPHAGMATAVDIDDNANLVVRLSGGETVLLSSGDVSIHL